MLFARFVVDRTRVGNVTVEQQVVATRGDSIEDMRRQAADHVAGRYKVPVHKLIGRTRLGFLEGATPNCVDEHDAAERAVAAHQAQTQPTGDNNNDNQ